MKNLFSALLIIIPMILTPGPCSGQSTNKSGRPDLRKFSSEQLKACFDDAKVCGSDDVYDISDELAHRLPKLPSEQLVACFDDWKICGAGEDQASGWPISDELARRGNLHELLVRYWTEPKWTIRDGIEHVAYHFDNPEVTSFMNRVFAQRVKDGEDRYWPTNYLAKKCDASALKELSTGRYRGQGCMQYETSVKLFGKCKYRPAIPYLAETAVHDACLNVVDAADRSLHTMYPDAPKDFDKLEEMQAFFCSRAHQEGFNVHCDSK
jgi:hypothetical protein